MVNSYTYSIIIPAYNAEQFVLDAINSALSQDINSNLFEIIIVNDGSIDKTDEICRKQYAKNITYIKEEVNLGVAAARNLGIETAKGKYLLFLDADDLLSSDALSKLLPYTENNYDYIAFNMSFANVKTRNDLHLFYENKDKILSGYLSLTMTGSACSGIFLRSFIIKNNIRFIPHIYHEDVAFMFDTLFYSKNLTAINNIGYTVRHFDNSRSSSITKKHIDDFFLVYSLMREKINDNTQLMKYWNIGIKNLIAIKLRDIYYLDCDKAQLYNYLLETLHKIEFDDKNNLLNRETQYFKLYLALLENKTSEIGDILKKKWSCFEIQNTLSFSPNKVSCCLVRHFYKGKWKDGATLINIKKGEYTADEIVEKIFFQKQKLVEDINKGIDNDCDGCPFLQFKEWEKLKRNLVRIDFITTTICNFKCTYCAEDNHDNRTYSYNLNDVVTILRKENITKNLKQCSWAGGEITIDKNFDNIITSFSKDFPNIKQTIFTNAAIFSNALSEQVKNEDNVLITSVDAGTPEIFKLIHEKDMFYDVLENLRKYAEAGSKNMIVKYILLDENCSLDELKLFVDNIKKYKLVNCVFQISCNSAIEKIPINWIEAGIYLYALLFKCGVRYCFIDEYFHFRMGETLPLDKIFEIKLNLQNMSLPDVLEDADNYSEVALWGSASQIHWFMNKTHFFNTVRIREIVHSYPERIGTKVDEYIFKHPDILKTKINLSILMAGVQGIPSMLCEFEKLGLDKNRLIKGIIL